MVMMKFPWAKAAFPIRNSVRTKVLVLVLASVILPSAVFGIISWRSLKESIEAGVHRELEVTARNLGRDAGNWIEDRRDELRAINRKQSLLQLESAGLLRGSASSLEVISENLLRQKENHERFAAFALVDQDGRVILQAPAGFAEEKIRPPEGISTGSVEGDVGRLGDRSFIILASLVAESPSAPGRTVPQRIVLLGLVSPDRLEKDVSGTEQRAMRTFLAAKDGTTLSPWKGATPARELRQLFTEGQMGILHTYTGAGGRPSLGLSSRLDDLPVFLVNEVNREHVERSLGIYRLQLAGVTVGLVVLLLMPALLLARRIILPLEDLGQAARRISNGEVGLEAGSRADGEMGQLIAHFNDMSRSLKASVEELRQANSQLNSLSITDSLTGVANRRHLEDRLLEAVLLAHRSRQPLSVIMIDIDHFKSYNDRYGHRGGDLALQEVARLVVSSVRETDLAGRYGGEEFLVVLPQTGREGAVAVAEKIRRHVSGVPLVLDGQDTVLTLSLGVGTLPDDADSMDGLVEAADRSLYLAKAEGRDRVVGVPPPPSPAPV